MKIENLILLGALGIGAYLIYRALQGQQGTTEPGGWVSIPTISPASQTSIFPVIQPNIPVMEQNLPPFIEPTTPPQAVEQAQQAGATVYARAVGTTPQYVATRTTSTRAALLTVGTPEQQIQTYNVAPRLITVGGKVRKVM